MNITIGAPKRDVTADMLSSVGAKIILAIRSLKRQNMAPDMNDAGIKTTGFDVLRTSLIKKGMAIPINEIGPA